MNKHCTICTDPNLARSEKHIKCIKIGPASKQMVLYYIMFIFMCTTLKNFQNTDLSHCTHKHTQLTWGTKTPRMPSPQTLLFPSRPFINLQSVINSIINDDHHHQYHHNNDLLVISQFSYALHCDGGYIYSLPSLASFKGLTRGGARIRRDDQ